MRCSCCNGVLKEVEEKFNHTTKVLESMCKRCINLGSGEPDMDIGIGRLMFVELDKSSEDIEFSEEGVIYVEENLSEDH